MCEITTPILNDDCLYFVFEHLSLEERVGVVRVSKQWQRVIREMMDFGVKSIAIRDSDDKNLLIVDHFFFARDPRMFNGYLFANVNEVTICHEEMFLKPSHLLWLFERLPKLTSLNILNIEVEKDSDSNFEILASIAPRLSCLELWCVGGEDGRIFIEKFVKNAIQLKELHLSLEAADDMWLLREISSTVEKIELQFLTAQYLNVSLANKVKNLRQLSVVNFCLEAETDNERAVLGVFRNFPNLQVLDLGFIQYQYLLKNVNNSSFRHSNLKKLSLGHFAIACNCFAELVHLAPNLTSLRFSAFTVLCENFNSKSGSKNAQNEAHTRNNCPLCVEKFVNFIPDLTNLKDLSLKPSRGVLEFVNKGVRDLLVNDRLESLRKLSLNHSVENVALFREFRRKAERNSKKSFRLVFDLYLSRDVTPEEAETELRSQLLGKPRNLTFRFKH